MNVGNLAQKTTWKFGSNALQLFDVMLQDFSIPGLSFTSPEVYCGAGAVPVLHGDSISYDDLECTLILDEKYKLYFELMKYVFAQVNPENKTHASQIFDVFVILTDNKGHDIFKVDFYNCRFANIGSISLSTQGDETVNTITATIKYDYFLIDGLAELAKKGIDFAV